MAKTERTNEQRVIDELIAFGGEIKLEDLSIAERKVWDTQALVLSYYRQGGDLSSAAQSAGIPHTMVHEWVLNDELGFKSREFEARCDIGELIAGKIIDDVLSGKQKSPGIIKLLLEKYSPRIFSTQQETEEEQGKRLMEEVRSANADFHKSQAEEPDEEDFSEFFDLTLKSRN